MRESWRQPWGLLVITAGTDLAENFCSGWAVHRVILFAAAHASAQSWLLQACVPVAWTTPHSLQPTTTFATLIILAVQVQDDEGWIAFFPGPFANITFGVDHSHVAPVIGSMWHTWRSDDTHFR